MPDEKQKGLGLLGSMRASGTKIRCFSGSKETFKIVMAHWPTPSYFIQLLTRSAATRDTETCSGGWGSRTDFPSLIFQKSVGGKLQLHDVVNDASRAYMTYRKAVKETLSFNARHNNGMHPTAS